MAPPAPRTDTSETKEFDRGVDETDDTDLIAHDRSMILAAHRTVARRLWWRSLTRARSFYIELSRVRGPLLPVEEDHDKEVYYGEAVMVFCWFGHTAERTCGRRKEHTHTAGPPTINDYFIYSLSESCGAGRENRVTGLGPMLPCVYGDFRLEGIVGVTAFLLLMPVHYWKVIIFGNII
ncbi:hypothetical protein WA026_001433 [Henosepilachna vigintioctopunctata]|uniref:Uncharacterized protein n=1 Tax=Henosepilachna vigintioctopunctata TaxID=420089 RepID=A0AAW1UUK6_9CUCU